MCMLFGFNANKRFEIRGLAKAFFNFSIYHPHGWGLALYDNKGDNPVVMKQAKPAYKSQFLKDLINTSVVARTAIGHIRFKTIGKESNINTHPFVQRVRGEDWVLAHNGSIDIKLIKGKTFRKTVGETDSERISCYIADVLDKLPNGAVLRDKIACIEDAVYELSQHGKLNLIISNGMQLFVHTNCEDTLYRNNSQGAVVFCTKPISGDAWKPVPLNRLFVYEDGKRIYEGKPHANTFTVNDKEINNRLKGVSAW